MDILATSRVPDELQTLSRHAALTSYVAGEVIEFASRADLGLIAAGQARMERAHGPSITLAAPSVLLRSETDSARATAEDDLYVLPLSYETCAALVARHKACRDLFFAAMTGRIRLFHTHQSPLIPAYPVVLH
ncbi:hypothetical protein [Tateyamaria omphalii]|uniref:Uncharacterized protein n=1 Tax=Tateyamaria omphalii TaxID=299262 RepID=A0A1P8MVH3_9RHOB|nr:hypothetical protein [Tateyamaria omphalii]APX12021.1 hypothetical protein BWR18_10270 [Tateyamaria omphalii]